MAYWADALGFLEVDRGDDFAVLSAGEHASPPCVALLWVVY